MARVFDLTDSDGTWFDTEDGVRVKIRNTPPDVFNGIKKKSTKKREVFKKVEGTPWRFEIEDVNIDLQNELFWDYVIVDWEGVVDMESKPIPCTKENKVLMMNRGKGFASLLAEWLREITGLEAKEAEAAEKN